MRDASWLRQDPTPRIGDAHRPLVALAGARGEDRSVLEPNLEGAVRTCSGAHCCSPDEREKRSHSASLVNIDDVLGCEGEHAPDIDLNVRQALDRAARLLLEIRFE